MHHKTYCVLDLKTHQPMGSSGESPVDAVANLYGRSATDYGSRGVHPFATNVFALTTDVQPRDVMVIGPIDPNP